MDYQHLDKCPDREKVIKVMFFRHQGLYMCHAKYQDRDDFSFYLTERNEFITKGQARKRLQELFPNAEINLRVVPRNSARDRW